jgi:hypothetical protein
VRWLHDFINRNSPHHAMLCVVEASIIEQPHEWVGDSYTRTNAKRRLTIWVANAAYGFALHDGLTYHGSPKIHLSVTWKRRMWRAFNGHKSAESAARAREIVARFDMTSPSNVVPIHRSGVL